MRVALLVGVLLLDAVAGLYDMGWMDLAPASGSGAQVTTMEDFPPPPPSWP